MNQNIINSTIRKDLADYLLKSLVECKSGTDYNLVDDIIKLIEERIDSILKEEPHNTIEFAEGFATAIIKVKELLK